MEMEVLQDGVCSKLSTPFHAGRIHIPGFLKVMLPRAQEAPQKVLVCTSSHIAPVIRPTMQCIGG
jgi:hypothetical protein